MYSKSTTVLPKIEVLYVMKEGTDTVKKYSFRKTILYPRNLTTLRLRRN